MSARERSNQFYLLKEFSHARRMFYEDLSPSGFFNTMVNL